MDRTIKVVLSEDGINEAIRELNAFQEELNSRCADAVTAVAKEGAKLIDAKMPEGKTFSEKGIESGSDTTHTTTVSSSSGTNPSATITLEGSEIMFIEFGSGVHYNGHTSNSFGTYEIGSYGQHHGLQDVWGYKGNGGTILSYGTPAAEPVYKTYIELRDGAGLETAKEAFN